jgi:hypothetical protein
MKIFKKILSLAAAAFLLSVSGCDMTYISNSNSPTLEDGSPNPEYGGNGPYLTIAGLPRDTARNNLSDIFLYNMAGKVARCKDYAEILISPSGYSVTAWVPLVYDGNTSERFLESGNFVVTFTANVDVNIQISKTYADLFATYFSSGAALVDLSSDWGFFQGGLLNPSDTSAPIVKSGTSFEMNGAYYKVSSNTIVDPLFSLDISSLVYLYAVPKTGGFSFEYSVSAPAFSAEKKGYYRGDRRALFKLIYLKGYTADFVAKSFISDPWEHFSYFDTVETAAASLTQVYSLSGAGNPAPRTETLPPGAYIVVLSGAGGGDVYNYSAGSGGYLCELLIVRDTAAFTFYSGAGGAGSGERFYKAGGGGSGTFIYSPDGYLAVAGGGGGSGGFSLYGDYYGGAGGSVGPGGSGDGGQAGGGASCGILGNRSGYAYNSSFYALYSEYPYPEDWKNSNGANGYGGNNRGSGSSGGNNRNSLRGGGAGGGSQGSGGGGSLAVYRVSSFPF